MSKLNEEIIDILHHYEAVAKTWNEMDFTSVEWTNRQQMYNRAKLLLNYCEARRHIEECRRDEEEF